ncbi:HNH endonuclease [Aquabacterium sp. A7-Y]|uniref:HNH endonuclease signature motif containing protein n=1 Tax=Aquabacterium sp. A7-Y TaxID=1349605 RepID=UPI00223D708F|nr:HNH endonuclease signature motif containing protein [Aquabacterium sp. A7-Y]MCW7540703.1 HNH endonuclease [Aquabacterium sp. A7-Y]
MAGRKGRQPRPLVERFWEKVQRREDDECWLWVGSIDTRGYGSIGADGGKPLMRAHRVAYQLEVGPIPAGLVVCHRCDNRACVNPRHLFVATQRENVLDMIRKGRRHSSAGERSPFARLTAEQVLAIRGDSRPPKVIRAEYGISKTGLRSIQRRKTWSHLP